MARKKRQHRPISEAAMFRCARLANKAERRKGHSSKVWHRTFDRCVERTAANQGLSGGKPTLMQEFARAGEVALEKLRLKRKHKR
jgi:hypothetical protein